METPGPTHTAELFSPLHTALVGLLRGLSSDDWLRPTLAGTWLVRDIAAHLLDVDLRRLSMARDGHRPAPAHPVSSFAEIVSLIDSQNASGVAYAARLSPRVITDLLEVSGRWISELMASLPPHEEALFPVAWAGEARSENWMDVGREYTERWHHQMQIREAVGANGLLDRRWLFPALDLSVQALPRALEGVTRSPGTSVVLRVEGAGDAVWSVVQDGGRWQLWRGAPASATTEVVCDADTAWKLFYNALPPDVARERLRVHGDGALAEVLLRARSVMVS